MPDGARHEAGGRGAQWGGGRALAALDEDLGLLVVAPVDVLSWNEELGEAARETTPGSATRELWITGVIADRARLELQQLDWIVHDRVHR